MIPAKPGLQVVYSEFAKRRHRDELVAWSDRGWPMVFRGVSLEEVYPLDVKTIVEWQNVDPHPDFVQLAPVEGLHVLYRRHDGTLFEDEAIGWGTTSSGVVVPVVIEDNMTMSAAGMGNYVTAFRERDREATYALYSRDAEVEADFQAEVDAAKSREV